MIASFQTTTTGSTTRSTCPTGCPSPSRCRAPPSCSAGIDHPVARFWATERAVRHAARRRRRSTSRVEGEHVAHQAVWMKAVGAAARRPEPAPRRARLRERLHDPRAGPAGATASRGRRPGSRSRASTTPCGGTASGASTSGCSTCRSRRTRIGGRGLSPRAHLRPRRGACSRASPRRA